MHLNKKMENEKLLFTIFINVFYYLFLRYFCLCEK